MRVLSTELSSHAGERVTIAGWLHAKRELGAVSFVLVRDRAGLAQIVIDPSNSLLQGREALGLSAESVVEVSGRATAVSAQGDAADDPRSRAGCAPAPAGAGEVPDRGRVVDRLPVRARRAR